MNYIPLSQLIFALFILSNTVLLPGETAGVAQQISSSFSENKHFKGGRTKRKENRDARPKVEHKTMRYMNLIELEARKNELVVLNDFFTAIKYVEKMVPLCDDLEKKAQLMVELADLNFKYGNLKIAQKMYEEYTFLYPSSDKTEYAFYQAILCSFYSILALDRDQTKTQDTIKLTQEFLVRQDAFTLFKDQVKSIQSQCYNRLFDHERYVFDYYLNIKGNCIAAQKRLESIERNYTSIIPDIHEKVALLHTELAIKKDEIAAKFAEYHNISKQDAFAKLFPTEAPQLSVVAQNSDAIKKYLEETAFEVPEQDAQETKVSMVDRF